MDHSTRLLAPRLRFALLALAALGAPQAHAEKIVLGNSVHGLHSLPIYVAANKGLFKQTGLEIEVVNFQGGATATPALLGGSTQIQAAGTENMLKLAQQGQAIVAVMTVQSTMNGAIMIRPDIAEKLGRKPTVADLKGLRIGTLARGGTADMAVRYIAKTIGLDAEKDLTMVPILGFDKHLAALQAKDIDASLTVEPVQTFWSKGPAKMVYVVDMLKGEGPAIFQNMGWVTLQGKKDWIANNREAVRKIVGVIVEAQRMIADEANLAEVVKLAQVSFPNVPAPMLEASIRNQLKSYAPEFTEEMVAKNNELLVSTGNLRAPIAYTSVVDPSFADLWAAFRKK